MKKQPDALGPVSNGGAATIDTSAPWSAKVEIEGVAGLLFHRWNNESVKTKSDAIKGSKAKKTDDVESYLWRNETGHICLPGEYFRQSIIHAAKYLQDPRSPRGVQMKGKWSGLAYTRATSHSRAG